MSQKNKDKGTTQTQLKSSADDDSILDEQNFDPKTDSTEDSPKEPGNVAIDDVKETSGNPDNAQTAAETPETANNIDESAAEDKADQQPSLNSQAVTADEGEAESKAENRAPADGSTDQDLSAVKDSDALDENKETRPTKENSDDKRKDASLAGAESADFSQLAASKSSFKDGDEDSAAEKQNELNNNAGKDQSEQGPNDTEAETEDLPELEPKKKIPLAKAAMTAILVATVFSGFFIFDNKSNIKSAEKTKSEEATKASAPKASQKKLKPAIQPDDPNYIYYAKIDEISALRDALLHKNEEILALKEHYHSGIAELEKEILDELQHPDNVTYLQAIENKRIEFALRTIQRRLAYIQQLDRPAQWAFQAAEDLLYIKRKALMDIQVAEVASGIDMNMHVQHMNTALNKYRPTADKLAIDMIDAPSESLESIWQQIQNKRLAHLSQRFYSKNQIIFEQICTGNFSRLAELSEISVDSAKCIVEMQGSDLFLNGLTEISPSAARHLFRWKGNWICLNGFRALSPRVAAYLFQWEGRWISLNGLTDFPPEIGNQLLQWGGGQLELMGLRYTDGSAGKIGIKYLAQWERSGGKLFVPKTIRKKIDEINASQRSPA
jgi:hypothetical protein